MKIFAFLFIFLLYLAGNFYVFYRIWHAVPPSAAARVGIVIVPLVLVASIILFFTIGDSLPIGLASFLYKLGTSWIFIFLYLLLIFFAEDLLGLANRFLHFMPSDTISRYTKDNWTGLGFVLSFVTLVMICGYLKYQYKVRVELPITIHKEMLHGNSLKIVAVSDLHLGYNISTSELADWVALINAEQPDVVLIGGDLIDSNVRPLNASNYAAILKTIQAPKGVYACLGNHEYIAGILPSIQFIKEAGIQLLRDSYAEIDSSYYIVGRDDRSNPKRKSLATLLTDLDKSKPIIVLDHQPYKLEEAEAAKIDIQFSGHTHQGQVWPISIITGLLYEQDHGLARKGNTSIFVSSGMGIWGGKFRIGTQSEYVVMNITTK